MIFVSGYKVIGGPYKSRSTFSDHRLTRPMSPWRPQLFGLLVRLDLQTFIEVFNYL